MPRDYDLDGTPEGVFGAELRFYRTQAGLSQAELATLVNISHDVISKIETGERAPAKAFPERLDAVPELDTRATLARLWNRLSKSARHRVYPGWFDRWPDAEARAIALRTFEPLVVPGGGHCCVSGPPWLLCRADRTSYLSSSLRWFLAVPAASRQRGAVRSDRHAGAANAPALECTVRVDGAGVGARWWLLLWPEVVDGRGAGLRPGTPGASAEAA